jgi:hypothetical protein
MTSLTADTGNKSLSASMPGKARGMFVNRLVGAFSKFQLADRSIKGIPDRPEGRRHQPGTPG